jgi:hypothetical protein
MAPADTAAATDAATGAAATPLATLSYNLIREHCLKRNTLVALAVGTAAGMAVTAGSSRLLDHAAAAGGQGHA